eukprot:265351_1
MYWFITLCTLIFAVGSKPQTIPGVKAVASTDYPPWSEHCDTYDEWFACPDNYGWYENSYFQYCCGPNAKRYCPIGQTQCAESIPFPGTMWMGCCPDGYTIQCSDTVNSVWCCPPTHPYCITGTNQCTADATRGHEGQKNRPANTTACGSINSTNTRYD